MDSRPGANTVTFIEEEPFALAAFSGSLGGLLLDARTGALVSLNASALEIWTAKLGGEPAESIVDRLTLKIGQESARKFVSEALGFEAKASSRFARPGPFSYRFEDGKGVVSLDGHERMLIDPGAETVRLLDATCDEATFKVLLRATLTRLIPLLGFQLLHGSAVKGPRGLIAFVGESGAGKTTTARCLAQVMGAPIAAEDKLVFVGGQDESLVAVGCEYLIEDWIQSCAEGFNSGASEFETGPLMAIKQCARASMGEINVIDVSRREPGMQHLRRTWSGVVGGAALLLNHFFHADPAFGAVSRALSLCSKLSLRPGVFAMSVPSGLADLRMALQAYSRNVLANSDDDTRSSPSNQA